MPEHFVPRGTDPKELKSGVFNKFKGLWLEERDNNGDFLSSYELNIVGKGFIFFLQSQVNIGVL